MSENERHMIQISKFSIVPALALMGVFSVTAVAAQPTVLVFENDPGNEVVLEGQFVVDLDGQRDRITVKVADSDWPLCVEGEPGPDPEACVDSIQVDTPTFTVSPTSVQPGGTFQMTWSSRGAYECEGQGTLAGWSGRSNLFSHSSLHTTAAPRTVTVSVDADPGQVTASIICRNGERQEQSLVRTVTINEPTTDPDPQPTACDHEDRSMPSNWLRLTTGINSCFWNGGIFQSGYDCSFWTRPPGSDPSGIWGTPFWQSTGNTRRLATNRRAAREYVAIQIDTTGLPGNYVGRMLAESAGSMFRTARTIYSISECPGDFSTQAVCTNNISVGVPFGGSNTDRDCALEAGRIYYLNLVASESPVGTPGADIQPSCNFATSNTACGWVYDISNF